MRSTYKSQANPQPQRNTVRNKLASRSEKPSAPVKSTSAAKPVERTEETAMPKLSAVMENKIAQLQCTQPTSEGHYELNQLMSHALESELQKVMIKVWQELPDSPSSEAEKVVADKFRNEAGDDLKNALGLNVTKRIMNVCNPLCVKIEFDKKPHGGSIQNFLRWLNCTAMNRVLDGQHNYVAQLRKISDFDRVTSATVMRIGDMKAKITPHYKFLRCPSNLKTIYKVSTPKTRAEKAEIDKQESKNKENTDANKNVSETVTTAKKPAQTKTDNTKTVETQKKQETKTETAVKPSTGNKKPTDNKTPAENKTNVTKTTAVKPTEEKNPAENKTNVTKTTENKKPDNKNPGGTQTNATKTTTVKPPTENKTNVAKTTPTKVGTVSKKDTTANKTTTQTKSNTKDSKTDDKPKSAQITAKSASKHTTKSKTPNTTDKSKQRKSGDFDVLGDEDILALMSNAIVLDECSGSDED